MASSVLPVPALPTMVTRRISSLSSTSSAKDCSLLRGRIPQTPSLGVLISWTKEPRAALYLPTALCCGASLSRSTTKALGGGVATPAGQATEPEA